MQGTEIFRALNEKLGYIRVPRLPGPASSEQVEQIEERIGHRFPATLASMYLAHNGEILEHGRPSPCYFFNQSFYGLEEVALNIEAYFSGYGSPEENKGVVGYPYLSIPPDCIKERYYMGGWVPFAGTCAPTHYAIDYVPGPKGKVGQVINVNADGQERYVMAPDFDSFLGMMMRAYDQRRLHRRFGWKSFEETEVLAWASREYDNQDALR